MNPKWRDYIIGPPLFLLAAILICWGRAAHSMTPAQQHAIAEAGAIAASLPVIPCGPRFVSGGSQMRPNWQSRPLAHCGANFTLTVQAVIGQESSYCTKLVDHRDPSYGCGGLTLKTAREIAGRHVSARELVRDRALNLRLSASYLHALIARFGWARGLYAYNHGDGAAEKATARQVERDRYLLAIRKRITEVEATQ